MKNELVVKSNYVIEASYRLTLSEQRLILLCVEQIKKGQALSIADSFTVSAMDFADMFNTPVKNVYRELQTVSDRLYERSVTVHNPDPDNPKIATTKTRWISSISYIPDEGQVILTFAQKMIPYIAMLEGGFTRYNLQHITNMHSVYGIRFYEFFKCWLFGSSRNTKKISLEALKETLELTGKYPSIKDFKLNVLDKAMQDINECSDLGATYKTLKTGRKITHIEFEFWIRKQPTPPPEAATKKADSTKIDSAYIQKHALAGESWEEAARRLRAELRKPGS